jgi:hypothetical protein
VSHFLLDGTTSIFEPKRNNSGMRGGMFLERMKVKRADGKVRGWSHTVAP